VATDWQTPTGSMIGSRRQVGAETREDLLPNQATHWPTPGANDHKGSAREGQRRGQLDEAVEQLWPTPSRLTTGGEDLRATWNPGSKPVREDGKHLQNALTTCTQIWDRDHSRQDQPTSASGDTSSPRDPTSRPRLNPAFVEWLMGVHQGWTDFVPLGTEWYRWSLLMRLCLFGLVSMVVKNERTAGKAD
jgi:hypothetical protein